MIELSMEIPTKLLEDISPLCELDFALAHKVLEDEEYAKFYEKQSRSGRRIILDNSFHELGHPVAVRELHEAANRVRPTVVVAPDKLRCPKANLEWFLETWTSLNQRWNIGVVLSGNTPEERLLFWTKVRSKTNWLFLPYREERLEWFSELLKRREVLPPHIHLLGVSSLEELQCWAEIHHGFISKTSFSVDTNKAVKWGMKKERIEGKHLRGAGMNDLDADVDEVQVMTILWNIAFLRRYLG